MDKYSRISKISDLALRRKVKRIQRWAVTHGLEISY